MDGWGISSGMGTFSVISFFITIVNIGLFVVGIYCIVLFIKLARRGIDALDLYIDEKRNRGPFV